MPKLIKYMVVEAYAVDDYLNDGWELYGDPMIELVTNNNGLSQSLFYQAVVLKEGVIA